jgi:hypothetical protein
MEKIIPSKVNYQYNRLTFVIPTKASNVFERGWSHEKIQKVVSLLRVYRITQTYRGWQSVYSGVGFEIEATQNGQIHQIFLPSRKTFIVRLNNDSRATSLLTIDDCQKRKPISCFENVYIKKNKIYVYNIEDNVSLRIIEADGKYNVVLSFDQPSPLLYKWINRIATCLL